jgi:hypothetical protein
MPERLRLSRRSGWRLPARSRSVARPHVSGNPFTPQWLRDQGGTGDWRPPVVAAFREWLTGTDHRDFAQDRRVEILARLHELRGLNLACWCPLDGPCHADVLIEVANRPQNLPSIP